MAIGEDEVNRLNLEGGDNWIVQEYMPEILQIGEISHVYFNGKFDCGYVKFPAKNELIIQNTHGAGRRVPLPGYLDTDRMRDYSRRVHDAVEEILATKLGYARVDFVPRKDGRICLIEMELFEPVLLAREGVNGVQFGSADKYAEALIKSIKQ